MKHLIFFITLLTSCNSQKKDEIKQDNYDQDSKDAEKSSERKEHTSTPSPIEPQKSCLVQNFSLNDIKFIDDYKIEKHQITSKSITQHRENYPELENSNSFNIEATDRILHATKTEIDLTKNYQFHFKNLPPQTLGVYVEWLVPGNPTFLFLQRGLDFDSNAREIILKDNVFTIPGEAKFLTRVVYEVIDPKTQKLEGKILYEFIDLDEAESQE